MIIDDFKLLGDYFQKTTKMIIDMANSPDRLEQCELEVYKDETRLVLSEMGEIVDEFRKRSYVMPLIKQRVS